MTTAREFTVGSALIGEARTVFPAAAQPADDQQHPAVCACAACTNALLADLRRPLVEPGPRRDPALDRRRRR